jgi:hypothetical protein
MRHSLGIFLLVLSLDIHSQANTGTVRFAGHYSAKVDESNLTLIIEPKVGTTYTGILNDGYTSLTLELEQTGTSFTGIGKESSTGVEMNVAGGIEGDKLLFTLIVDPYGDGEDVEINFTRDNSGYEEAPGVSNQIQHAIDFPPGATHPQEMLGTWTKEELYQSGYGDSYMGAGSSQSMTFLSGGRMAEAGSSSYISGSNYSGQSEGEGGGVIPDVTWYTIGNQLYMQGIENGQLQNIHLGKYYVENNNMLITGTNGEKILLTRK